MTKKEYEIVSGDLGAVRELTDAGYRLQTARELQDDRCKDGQESIRNGWFYVADGNVFYRDPKTGVLSWAHTDGTHNLVVQPQYLERALRDLPNVKIFRPDNAQESWDAIKDRSTNRFDLSDLKLVRGDDEFSFMPIKTGEYDGLSPVQQRAASVVGFTHENVAYLSKKGIRETKLWLLNPEYVAQVLAEENCPFWRASLLYGFGRSLFSAGGRIINDNNRLRGVRQVVAEGEAPQNELERVLEVSRDFVVDTSWSVWAQTLQKEYNRYKQ